MRVIKIAVVDDYAPDSDALCELIMRFAQNRHVEVGLGRCRSSMELLRDYAQEYDVIFLDIEMPGINGLEAARIIRQTDETTILVFVTNMAHLAINGYSVEALDFIVKPADYYSVEMVMRKALARIERRGGGSVTVVTREAVRVLPFARINYVEVRDHYVTYHTLDGDLRVRGSLAQVEKDLASGNFLRCNRWYIVNVERVTSVVGNVVRVGDAELEVSRSNKQELLRAVAKTLGGAP